MPATPTEPTPSVGTTGSASATTASFTPAANALITAKVTARDSVARDAFSAFAATFGLSRGWLVETYDDDEGGSDFIRCIIGTCVTSSSPGAGVVSATFAGAQAEIHLEIAQVASGFDPTSPVRQSEQYESGNGQFVTPTDNLPVAPLAASLLIAGAMGTPQDTNAGPATGYTELGEHDTATMQSNLQYAPGTNGATFGVVWASFNKTALAAIEVEEVHTHVGRPYVMAAGERTTLGSTTHQNGTNVTPLANARVYLTAWWAGGFNFVSLSQPWGPWTQHIVTSAYGSAGMRCGIFSCDAGASPAAGAPLLTLSGGSSILGYELSQFIGHLHATTPTRQTLEFGAASLAGGVPMSQSFASAPLAGSQILAIAAGRGNDRWGPATPGSGYIKTRQPVEEGGGCTAILFFTNIPGHSNLVSTTLGENTPGDDHTEGVVMAAVEVQSAGVLDVISRMPLPYTQWID